MDIREAVRESLTWKQFLAKMEQKGYQWKLDRKYIALKAPGMERYVRLKSLGKNYTEAAIRQWILEPKRQKYQPAGKVKRSGRMAGGGHASHTGKKRIGLQALYYSYLYRMGVLGKRPARAPYQIRADIRRLDQRIAQMDFLEKHGITTQEELLAYQKPLEEKVLLLIKERQKLYRKEPEAERIAEIKEELKPLRKEIKMCVKILQHSKEMEERMRQAEKLESQRKNDDGQKKQESKKREGER